MMGTQKRCLISREDIARRVQELAGEISRDYQGRDLVMVGVLKGAFIFLADLVRELSYPVEIDFVRLASYGGATSPTGEVQITKDVELIPGGPGCPDRGRYHGPRLHPGFFKEAPGHAPGPIGEDLRSGG